MSRHLIFSVASFSKLIFECAQTRFKGKADYLNIGYDNYVTSEFA